MKQLILNGDDFGLAECVNEGIEIAHRDGVLSSASLMVGGRAAADAVERARRLPRLRVGLHLVVVEGLPVLAPSEIPSLLDEAGELSRDLVRAGFRFFFLPSARRHLEKEIRAQLEAFTATGLELDHINAHNHMHLHPTVLNTLLRVARDFDVPAIRVPREPMPRRPLPRVLRALGLAPCIQYVERRLRSEGVAHNDHVLGLHDSGSLHEKRVLELLENLPDGLTEIFFHVARGSAPELERDTPDYGHEQELEALLSPAVRRRIEELALQPCGYRDLGPRGR